MSRLFLFTKLVGECSFESCKSCEGVVWQVVEPVTSISIQGKSKKFHIHIFVSMCMINDKGVDTSGEVSKMKTCIDGISASENGQFVYSFVW